MKKNRFNSVLAIVALVMIVNALSYGTIIPLLYPYASRFGITATGLSFLFASFSLAQLIATPIIGRLSDKYGRKPLLLLSLLGTSLSLGLFASAQSATMLFVARIMDGVTGGNISVAQAMLADVTKPEERARAFGMLGAIFGFGFVAGPALGGLLSTYGLTVPFWSASGLALVATILGLVFLPETNKHPERKPQRELLNIGAIKKAFTSPVTGPILFISLVALTAQNAMIIGFQSYTVDILRLSAQRIGLIFTMFGVITIVVQGFGIKWLLATVPKKRRLLQGLLLLAGLEMLVVVAGQGYWWFIVTILVYGVFSSPIPAILTSMVSERTSPEDQGGVLGVNQSLTSFAQIIGPLSAGALVVIDVRAAFVWTGFLLLMALVITRVISRRTKALDI